MITHRLKQRIKLERGKVDRFVYKMIEKLEFKTKLLKNKLLNIVKYIRRTSDDKTITPKAQVRDTFASGQNYFWSFLGVKAKGGLNGLYKSQHLKEVA